MMVGLTHSEHCLIYNLLFWISRGTKVALTGWLGRSTLTATPSSRCTPTENSLSTS